MVTNQDICLQEQRHNSFENTTIPPQYTDLINFKSIINEILNAG